MLFHTQTKQQKHTPLKALFQFKALSLLALLGFLCSCSLLRAQNIDFEFLSVSDGLSQNTVNCLLQDRQGFIWLGTEYGLNRYDGYHFSTYKKKLNDSTTLADNRVTALHEDIRGNIWVGTASGGLHLFLRESNSFKRYQHSPEKQGSISSNRITSIGSTSTGVLWVGTAEHGLNRLDIGSDIFQRIGMHSKHPQSVGGTQIRSISQIPSSHLWIAHENGFDMLEATSGNFTKYAPSPKVGVVNSIEAYNQEVVYLGSNNGVWLYECSGSKPETQLIGNIEVNDLQVAKDGAIWVGSSQGLWLRRSGDIQFKQYTHSPADRSGLSSSNIKCLHQDKSGILWIGTYGGGVNKYIPSKQRFGHFKHIDGKSSSLSHNYVTAMEALSNGQLWVGTVEGLDVFSLSKEKVQHYSANTEPIGLTNSHITCIAEGKDGIWIGTQAGLNFISDDRKKVKSWTSKGNEGLSSNNIYSLYEDPEGFLWIGTGNGLNRLNIADGSIQQYRSEPDNPIGLGGNIITDIEPSKNGWLWIATYDGGFYKFNSDTDIFKGYWREHSNGTSHAILSIYEANKETLWIGTFESGLYRFSGNTEQFERFSTEEGLPNNQVFGILPDSQGQLWCSTADRLVCFDPESETFRSYDIKDGLQGNEFSSNAYAKGNDDYLYFGGPNGFNAFNPNEITDNTYTPSVVITGFELFNKAVQVSKDGPLKVAVTELERLELEYWQNSFAFEFAGLSYQLPERNQYAYWLTDIDESWQHIGNRRKAYFTDIDPGEYIFKVKATNSDGVWNQNATEVLIIINSPFWQKPWFWLLIAIASIFLTRRGYLQFKKNATQESQKLQGENQELKQKLKEAQGILKDQGEKIQEASTYSSQLIDQVIEKDQDLRKFNRDWHESLSYAERIQQSQLTPQSRISTLFPKNFLIFQPKLKVGGDFYWLSTPQENSGFAEQPATVVAIGDCAGRGVSGALLSMVSMQMLDDIVNRGGIMQAKKIVDKLNKSFGKALNYNQGNIFYGMDLALCSINWQARQLEFVGAMRNIIAISHRGELSIVRGNNYPIGMAELDGMAQGFTRKIISFGEPTTFYLFTDGLEDQIGGEEHRKFGFRRLKELLLSIHELPMHIQKEKILKAMSEWRGDEPQIDDLCFLAFKLPEYPADTDE